MNNNENKVITKEQFNMYIAVLERSIQLNVPYSTIDPNNDIYNLKYYIKDHMNDENVLIFLKWVAEEYCKLILTDNVIRILNMPDEYKYYKKEKFCEYFPFKKSSFLVSQLYNIFYVDEEDFEYRSAIYRTLEKYFKKFYTYYDDETYKNFIEFIDNSKNLPLFESDYKAINVNDALKIYLRCINFDVTVYNEPHYLNFKENLLSKEMLNEDEVRTRYRNKLLGNIGEAYASSVLNNLGCENINNTALKAGDGLGYDIYFNSFDEKTDSVVENLVEVKTTENDFDKMDSDYFTLSTNEYKFMCDRLKEKDANYIIMRIYSNLRNTTDLNKAFRYGVLFPVDEYTLISQLDPTIKYGITYDSSENKYRCELKQNTRKRKDITEK